MLSLKHETRGVIFLNSYVMYYVMQWNDIYIYT